jgi:cell division protease FtsH
MNDLAKNLLLWVVIAVVLMAVFQSFTPRTGGNDQIRRQFANNF